MRLGGGSLLLSLWLAAIPSPSIAYEKLPTKHARRISLPLYAIEPPSSSPPPDYVFGKEFEAVASVRESVYWKGKRIAVLPRSATTKAKETDKFNRVKATLILDSFFVSALGFCLTWYFGSLVDSFSYGIGSLLGLGYANLLSKYVESIGTQEKSLGGNARFLPVILLILVYAKNKETVHIIPELIGFFSYQVGSLLQIFNADLYEEEES